MTHGHYSHHDPDRGFFAANMMLWMGAFLVASVVIGLLLIAASPWDNDGGGTTGEGEGGGLDVDINGGGGTGAGEGSGDGGGDGSYHLPGRIEFFAA